VGSSFSFNDLPPSLLIKGRPTDSFPALPPFRVPPPSPLFFLHLPYPRAIIPHSLFSNASSDMNSGERVQIIPVHLPVVFVSGFSRKPRPHPLDLNVGFSPVSVDSPSIPHNLLRFSQARWAISAPFSDSPPLKPTEAYPHMAPVWSPRLLLNASAFFSTRTSSKA